MPRLMKRSPSSDPYYAVSLLGAENTSRQGSHSTLINLSEQTTSLKPNQFIPGNFTIEYQGWLCHQRYIYISAYILYMLVQLLPDCENPYCNINSHSGGKQELSSAASRQLTLRSFPTLKTPRHLVSMVNGGEFAEIIP